MRSRLTELALLALAAACAGAPQARAASGGGASAPAPEQRPADATLTRALQDHDWTLQSATDAAGKPLDALLVPGHPFALRFDGARLSVRGDCNLLSGGWRLNRRSELVVGRVASTQRACEPALMAADAAVAALLAQPLKALVERGETPTLRLESPEGNVLGFAGRRTAKSLYGPPTRIFLEVAAQRVPCTPALRPPTTCLEVRELRFDDKGLRVGDPGPWQPFYAEIGGYTHQPGVSNVLRINRYRRPHAAADASAYVYELDLVVQSKVAPAPPAPTPPERAARRAEVVAAERAFAKTMADRDFAAFGAFVSEEAVFFDGDAPLRGKPAVLAAWKPLFDKPAAPFDWEPATVEVLDSGTLALSTGPVRNPAGKTFATFSSIWRMEAPGTWRVVFDRGNDVCDCAKK